jgi:hypothetical protein
MSVLWWAFSLCTATPWHRSLPNAKFFYYYDKVSHPPGLLPIPPDRAMLDIAAKERPDLMLFDGIADGARMPQPSTLRALRSIAPLVLLSGDLSDPPWWPYLETFKDERCFDVMVNFDGNPSWPKPERSLDLLTPIAHEFYPMPLKPLAQRIIQFGFAGGCASPSRWEIIGYLVDHAGLKIMPRDETYGSYGRFARYMMECQLTVNVPISGSDNSRQCKGRVLEAGLAGTCLLEHESSAAQFWFEAGRDYVVYRTREEAAELSRELLADVPRMEAIAQRLQRKVRENHSPAIFWQRIFEAVGK